MMRAKMDVVAVRESTSSASPSVGIDLRAVYKSDYSNDPLDEDNTYSMYTPMANLTMVINNPALVDKFHVGQRFYVDFTEIPRV